MTANRSGTIATLLAFLVLALPFHAATADLASPDLESPDLESPDLESPDLASLDLKNWALVDLLELFRDEGYEIVYSSDLVQANQKVPASPQIGSPIDRLQQVLHGFDLQLELISGQNWLVVRKVMEILTIEGTVVDQDRLPIPFATISSADGEMSANELGEFRLHLAPGRHEIAASALGYADDVRTIEVDGEDSGNLEISLQPVPGIENIVVTASRYELSNQDVGTQFLLSRQQIENAPTLGDDAIRAINSLPGSASIGFSARPRVRGGVEDEILMLFDDVELIEPFHLKDYQNLFSTFNPGTIRSVDFYTGGFPARYGNRMSAVLDIATQGVGQDLGGELSITAFSTSAVGFGRFSQGDWLVAARRGNLDIITDVVNPGAGDPSYWDALVRLGWSLENGSRFEANILNYTDRVLLNFNDSTAESHITNNYQWLRWEHDFKPGLGSTTILSHARINHRRQGLADDEDKLIGELKDTRDIRVITLQQMVEWKKDNDLFIEAGLYLSRQDARFTYVASAERGLVAPFIGSEEELEYDLKASPDGLAGGVYLSVTKTISDRVTIQPGIRLDAQDYLGTTTRYQFSPRFSVLYGLTPNTDIRLSLGRFYQPQGIHELQITDGVDRFFKPQRSDHAIISLQHRLTDEVSMQTEFFYKRIDVTKPRFTNLFNSFVLLPEISQDRVVIYADRAYARGLEWQISNTGTRGLYWWLNYSYAQVEDHVDGRWVRRKWDQPHTVNGGLNWEIGNWNLSVIGSWHTGWATTALPPDVEEGQEIDVETIRNNDRFRDFATVNFRLARDFFFSRSTLTTFIEFSNILNRTNDGGFDYAIVEEEDSEELLVLEKDLEPVIPLAASIGLILRF